jgi:hypothetical protein
MVGLSCFVCSSQVIKNKGDVRADTPMMVFQLRMVWEGKTDTGLAAVMLEATV